MFILGRVSRHEWQDVHCTYRVYLDEKDKETEKISLTANPDFNHVQLFKFKPATKQVLAQ